MFLNSFKSVSKVFQLCFKSVLKLFVCIKVIAATRGKGGLVSSKVFLESVCDFFYSRKLAHFNQFLEITFVSKEAYNIVY